LATVDLFGIGDFRERVELLFLMMVSAMTARSSVPLP